MPDSRVIVGDCIEVMREWRCQVLAADNAVAYSTTVIAESGAHAAQEAAEEFDDYMFGDVANRQRVRVVGLDGCEAVWWVEGEREGEPNGYRRDWYVDVPGQMELFEEG